jgi:hypothetical protein
MKIIRRPENFLMVEIGSATLLIYLRMAQKPNDLRDAMARE